MFVRERDRLTPGIRQDFRTLQAFGPQLDAHVYARVVPVLDILLDTSGEADSTELWRSIVSHFASCSSGSLLKKVAFRAIAAILEVRLSCPALLIRSLINCMTGSASA